MFRNRLTLRRREMLAGLAFAALPVLGFAFFYFVPFGITIYKTFTANGGRFVGLTNYMNVVTSQAFLLAAGNTLKFIGVGVPALLALALAVALAINRKLKGSSFYRAAFALPIVLPTASVVMVFQIIFPSQNVGGGSFITLLALYIWKNMGYAIILMAGGLAQIPRDLSEAARVDGAGAFTTLRKITLPMLLPTIAFTAMFAIMFAFKAFREAFALAGNYPNDSIYMLQHFMNNNFANLNYPRLSVAAVLTFIVIAALVWALFRREFREVD